MPKLDPARDVLADRYRLGRPARRERRRPLLAGPRPDARPRTSRCTSSPPTTSAPTGCSTAARRSATVHDPRLLRVLDADQADDVCYVVNEWGSGVSLDIMLASDGPLGPAPGRLAGLGGRRRPSPPPTRAGVAHGRLMPENVLVDRTGSVRLIGFVVDAALHGLPPGTASRARRDRPRGAALRRAHRPLGRACPAPPCRARPRRARPGAAARGRCAPASRARSTRSATSCSTPTPASRRDGSDLAPRAGSPTTCADFVGDPTGMRRRRRSRRATAARPTPSRRARAEPRARRPARPGAGRLRPADRTQPEPGDAARPEATRPRRRRRRTRRARRRRSAGTDGTRRGEPAAHRPGAAGGAPVAGRCADRQAGMPVFDDDNDDVSWLRARSTPAAAPAAVRGARPSGRSSHPSPPTASRRASRGRTRSRHRRSRLLAVGHRHRHRRGDRQRRRSRSPRTTSEEDDEVPGRSWMRLALVLGISLLLLVAVVVAFNLGRGRTPLGAGRRRAPRQPAATASASAKPITGLAAADFDPAGQPAGGEPRPGPARRRRRPVHGLADHDLQRQNFGPGGLKTGVGLVLDLGAAHDGRVGRPHLRRRRRLGLALRQPPSSPTGVAGLTPVATATAADGPRDGHAREAGLAAATSWCG